MSHATAGRCRHPGRPRRSTRPIGTGRYRPPMLPPRTRILFVAVPVASSLALAAPAIAAGESKGDRAILKAGVITKADVPAEWTSTPSKPRSDALKSLRGCKKVTNAVTSAAEDVPRARSREFADPRRQNATAADNAVYACEYAKGTRKLMSPYKGSAATNCFERHA